jgi:hypothetical protein
LAEKIGNSVGKWNQNKIISNKRIHRALVELEKILSYNRMISNKNSG